jgi:ribosomal protein S18 acetylase RimI-like enzyme
MAVAYTIRPAVRADVDTLVAFTLREACEAEGTRTTETAVRRGIEAAFVVPARATYWVVESSDRTIVGSTSITTEWSDFHGGDYWWIQSVFIVPEHRGHGLVERLLNHLTDAAKAAGALDLRLYAHTSNERALRAYRRCGFTTAPYIVMSKPLRPE